MKKDKEFIKKNKMVSSTYFANILLTADHPMGRSHCTTRKKADWFHSISIFSSTSIVDLPIGETTKCTVIHFHGHNGGPVLETFETSIKCTKKHIGKKLYYIPEWSDSAAVIGDIKTLDGLHSGYGECNIPIKNIISTAFNKWGFDRIPYVHQRNESYNCVGFVDDILTWADKGYWNDRIESMHKKHGLFC